MENYLETLKENKFSVEGLSGFYVYFLWDNGEIVYVGQTHHLQRRLSIHLKDKVFDEYSFVECENFIEMDSVELYFISKFKPKYNLRVGDGFESVKKIRNRIQSIDESYKYNSDFYVYTLVEKIKKSTFDLKKVGREYFIKQEDVHDVIKYILS